MSALQNEIDKLNTLKESFSELSKKVLDTQAVLTELNHGKQEIVDALATKNVQSSTDKTLAAIASDIRSIAQSPITIDGGEMYEKQLFGAPTDKTNAYEQPDTPIWNLYQVMTNLLNDGRFVKYNGIVLCEYVDMYDSIDLQGAGAGGAYLTSDGYLYEYDVQHVWDDTQRGKANRWVAYLFANKGSNYTITDAKLSPYSIHVGRYVGVISSTVNGGINDIIVVTGNELSSINFPVTQGYNKTMVLRNLTNQNGYVLYNTNVDKLIIENCIIKSPIIYSSGSYGAKTIHIGKNVVFDTSAITPSQWNSVLSDFANTWATSGYVRPSYMYIEEGTNWGTSLGLLRGYAGDQIVNFNTNIIIDGLKTLDSPIFGTESGSGKRWLSYTGLYMDTIEVFNVSFALKLVNAPFIKFISAKKAKRGFGLSNSKLTTPILEDVIVGEFENNLNLIGWTPTTIIATESGAELLDDNIRNHIAANVKDVSQGEPLTITFSQALRNVLTQKTEDLFASKGWNIAPTKSV